MNKKIFIFICVAIGLSIIALSYSREYTVLFEQSTTNIKIDNGLAEPDNNDTSKGNRQNSNAQKNDREFFCSENVIDNINGLKNLALNEFVSDLFHKNISWPEIDKLAEHGGLSLEDTNKLLSSRKYNVKASLDELFQYELASTDESKVLKTLLVEKQIGQLNAILGKNGLQKLYGGAPLYTFILNNTNYSIYEILDSMQQQDIRPTFLDIVIATKHKIDNEVTIELIQSSGIDRDYYWIDRDTLQSISLIAAKQFNQELLETWLFIINEQPNTNTPSELDFLPIPSSSQLESAILTVELLLDNGRIVETRLGYRKLLSWLPGSWIEKNGSRLSPPSLELNIESEQHLVDLNSILSHYSKRIIKANHDELACKHEQNKLHSIQQDMDYETRLKAFNNRKLNYVEPFELGELNSFSLNEEYGEYRNKLIKAILHNEWDVVFETLPLQSPELEQLALNVALSNALISNRPTKIIVELLEIGAELPSNTIHILAELGHIRLARDLLSYGLNVHYIDPVGKNAIEHLIYKNANDTLKNNYNSQKKEMLHFLSLQNVSLIGVEGRMNALNFALMEIKDSEIAIMYSLILIHLGAQIDSSHHQQMTELEKQDRDRYIKVIQIIPELDLNVTLH